MAALFDILVIRGVLKFINLFWRFLKYTGLWLLVVSDTVLRMIGTTNPFLAGLIRSPLMLFAFLWFVYQTIQNILRTIKKDPNYSLITLFSKRLAKESAETIDTFPEE